MKTRHQIRLLVLVASLFPTLAVQAESNPHRRFFAGVASGEVTQLKGLMDPALTHQVDDPVLQVWVQALNERLGKVTAIQVADRSSKQTFNGTIVETTAEVQFEKGTASSEMTTVNGRLIAFNVQSAQLGTDWFHGPAETDLYTDLGASLIQKIMAAEADAAYDMMHEAVHQTMDRDSFRELVGRLSANGGEFQTTKMTSSEMQITENSQMLVLNYEVMCTRASGTCEVKVQFIGLKGHLMGFQFR